MLNIVYQNTGSMQAGLLMKFCLFGQKARRLDRWQRLFGFFYSFLTGTEATLGVLGIISDILLFGTGETNVIFADMEQLKLLVRVAAIAWLLRYARLSQVALLSGYSATFREMCCIHFLNPCRRRTYPCNNLWLIELQT